MAILQVTKGRKLTILVLELYSWVLQRNMNFHSNGTYIPKDMMEPGGCPRGMGLGVGLFYPSTPNILVKHSR